MPASRIDPGFSVSASLESPLQENVEVLYRVQLGYDLCEFEGEGILVTSFTTIGSLNQCEPL